MVDPITKRLVLGGASRVVDSIPFDLAFALVASHLSDLLQSLDAGLVTEEEVAGAITDRFVVWLDRRTWGRFVGTDASWDVVVQDVASIIRAERTRSDR